MEPPIGHVVHLEPSFGAAAPQELRVPRRITAATKAFLGVLLVAATPLTAAAIHLLWTGDTPGWWFSLIFTVMLGGVVLGLWVVYLDSFRTAAEGRRAEAAWARARGTVVPEAARIVDRRVGLSDTGRVTGFDLTVALPDGPAVAAWHDAGLLQPQVPGIGAAARVWRADGALVVEVLDPTVVGDPA